MLHVPCCGLWRGLANTVKRDKSVRRYPLIKRCRVVTVAIPPILTLGIYGLIWLDETSDELISHNKQHNNPLVWLLLALLPPLNVVAMWWYSEAVAKMSASGDENALTGHSHLACSQYLYHFNSYDRDSVATEQANVFRLESQEIGSRAERASSRSDGSGEVNSAYSLLFGRWKPRW